MYGEFSKALGKAEAGGHTSNNDVRRVEAYLYTMLQSYEEQAGELEKAKAAEILEETK